jgi:hypothetical protein
MRQPSARWFTIPLAVLVLLGAVFVWVPPASAQAPDPAQDRMSPIDLVQVTLIVPGKLKLGKRFRVFDEVESAGTQASMQCVTRYYLSKDDKLDDQDLMFGGRYVPGIAPGRTSQDTTWVELPTAIEPGQYYVIAMVNATKTLVERYLDNNTRAVKITIQPAEVKK